MYANDSFREIVKTVKGYFVSKVERKTGHGHIAQNCVLMILLPQKKQQDMYLLAKQIMTTAR